MERMGDPVFQFDGNALWRFYVSGRNSQRDKINSAFSGRRLDCWNGDRRFYRRSHARPADGQGTEEDLVGALEVLKEVVGAQGRVVAGGAADGGDSGAGPAVFLGGLGQAGADGV